MLRWFCIVILLKGISNILTGKVNQNEVNTAFDAPNLQEEILKGGELEANDPSKGREDYIYPLMTPNQPFRFESWLSFMPPKWFYKEYDSGNREEPVWQSEDFDLKFKIAPEYER